MQGIKALLFCILALLPLAVGAQDYEIVKGGCTPQVSGQSAVTRGVPARLPQPQKKWDASKIYKQMVILVEFSDTTFSGENPQERYDRMFNERGYNEGVGAGCVADYFREQSSGLFNLEFDVYGPVAVSHKAQPYDNPDANTKNMGAEQFRQATQKVFANNPEVDYGQYDWDGNGSIDQIIFVYACLAGNQGKGSFGYIWPNSDYFVSLRSPDGHSASHYSASGELWKNRDGHTFGIGTIIHEFSHCLGLPDIYPTNGDVAYSVCDEWDLMDGGNYSNEGWCPPNYTAQEKMLLGWLTPIELTEPTTITGMKPVSEGGDIYIIKNTESEYFLLENRQWTGWDAAAPGKGLLISHVDYLESAWSNNRVNVEKGHFRYDFVHADSLDYEQWNLIQKRNDNQWTEKPMLHNKHLRTTPYPWSTDSTAFVNDRLTDDSTPAATTFQVNKEGEKFLSKAITNIRVNDDGLISFDFMGGDPNAIREAGSRQTAVGQGFYYDLQGRRIHGKPGRGLYIREGKKVIFK